MRGSFGLTVQQQLMASAAIVMIASASPAMAQTRTFNVPAGPASRSIPIFAKQAGVQILASGDTVRSKRTKAVKGNFTVDEGLRKLLDDSGLAVNGNSNGIITIGRAAAGDPQAAPRTADSERPGEEESGKAEILVVGQRATFNADVRRTEDDTQPYVVLTGEEIRRAGASNLEDYLRTQLPMNTQSAGSFQNGGGGNAGNITLRGLSAAQTLILVDGRRVPGVGLAGGDGVGQPNINGIPQSAIERIEVLPTTAGGIYGGGAVGGVINIILKHDYSGVDLDATYGNAFKSDVGYASIALNGGFSLEGGRTKVSFIASYSRQNDLRSSDRNFQRNGRELNWANRPADFSSPIFSSTPNICATTGTSTTCPAGAPNLVLDSGVALNSRFTSVPIGYAGPSSDGGAGLASVAGRFNFNPVKDGSTLFSAPRLQYYSLSVRRKFTDDVEAFIDLGYDQSNTKDGAQQVATVNLLANDPNNPFQQNIAVSIPLPASTNERTVKNTKALGGIIIQLPKNWNTSIEHSWIRNRNTLATRGALDFSGSAAYLRTIALRDPGAFAIDPIAAGAGVITNYTEPGETTLNDTILRLAGPLLKLPAGSIRLSGYLERRKEQVDSSVLATIFPTSSSINWYAPKSQVVHSAYVEARVPLVSPSLNFPLVSQFELFGAVRYDQYETVSSPQGSGVAIPSINGPFPAVTRSINKVSSTDYTVGVSYSPIPDITFRSSYGTSFLPPNLGQITSTAIPNSFQTFLDPKRGNIPVGTITVISGGNSSLKPEQSENLSAGVIFTPRFLPRLRVSVDYTRIRKTGEISTFPGGGAGLLDREQEFPGRVVRGPLTPADQALGFTAGPVTSMDLSAVNVAKTRVEAWDFQLDYELNTGGLGTFRPFLVATRQTELVRTVLATDPRINSVGLNIGPLKWRANFGLNWELGPWKAGWLAQYNDSYRICNSIQLAPALAFSCTTSEMRQGSKTIPSEIYNDIYVAYKVGQWAGPELSNMEIRFGVQNVLNKQPAILATTAGSGYNLFADPRLRRFTLAVRKHF